VKDADLNQPDPKAEKDEKERKDYGRLNDPSTGGNEDKSAIVQNEDNLNQDAVDQNYDHPVPDEDATDEEL
jgi:hypothetical protein